MQKIKCLAQGHYMMSPVSLELASLLSSKQISILHDQVTAFLHGQNKIFFFFKKKKDIQRTSILRLSNSKAPSKGKRYLLTSYNFDDFTKRAPHDDNGNVTLMAQGAKQDFILHFPT